MSPRKTRRGTVIHNITSSAEKKGRKTAASPKEKSRPSPKKRNTRAVKSKVANDSENNQSRNVSKKSSRKRPSKSEADSLITDDESITEGPKRERPSSILGISLITDDESTPRRRPASRASLSRGDTTPKSSPIFVPLTPHRSTKTPRMSPENFGSPKRHTDTPLRLSKTPRKLKIDGTPPSSEDSLPVKRDEGQGSKLPSSRSQPSPNPKKSPIRAVAKKSIKRAAPKSKKSPSPKKVAQGKTSPRINQSVSSGSKKANPESRRSMPASKVKKSPVKLRASSSKRNSSSVSKVAVVMIEKMKGSGNSDKSTPVKTPPPSTKRPTSVAKRRLPVPDSNIALKPVSTPNKPRISLKKNILEKRTKIASPLELRALQDSSGFIASTPRDKTRRSLNLSDTLNISPTLLRKKSSTPLVRKKSSPIVRKKSSSPIKVKSPSPVVMKSPSPNKNKTVSSVKKKSTSPVKKKTVSPLARKKSSSHIKAKSPSPIKKKAASPVKKKSPNPVKKKTVSPLARKETSIMKIKSRFFGIEDESEPAMSDTSLINMSDLFDSDVSQKEEEKKSKDGTYELLEPKTPTLQATKSRKRKSTDANLSGAEITTEIKKVCKVRFAESDKVAVSNVAKLRSGTPGHKLSLKRTSEVRSKSRSPQRLSKGVSDSTRRRSSSVSVVEGTPRTPNSKRRINSIAASNLKSGSKSQLASVNRLSRPRVSSVASEKKPNVKTPVPRKIPNFAEIHKKNFSKMESIVDGKKRVEERHIALVNPLITSATKSMPEVTRRKRLEPSKLATASEGANGSYNRFGFKIRRNEAIQSIAKKQPTMTSEKKKNARRDILKGVRTNRRFELQMKSRKSLGSQ